MTKIIDFIKNHTYAFVNITGAVLVLLTILFAPLSIWALLACAMVYHVIRMYPIIFVPVTAVNIAAFVTVIKHKTCPGIILAMLGGGIGAMLASMGSKGCKTVKIIFLIQIWLIAWLAEGYLLYSSGIHELSLGF